MVIDKHKLKPRSIENDIWTLVRMFTGKIKYEIYTLCVCVIVYG